MTIVLKVSEHLQNIVSNSSSVICKVKQWNRQISHNLYWFLFLQKFPSHLIKILFRLQYWRISLECQLFPFLLLTCSPHKLHGADSTAKFCHWKYVIRKRTFKSVKLTIFAFALLDLIFISDRFMAWLAVEPSPDINIDDLSRQVHFYKS